jgi:Na+/H+-dicarboxylate symporter
MKTAFAWYRGRSIGTKIFLGMAVGIVVGFWMGPSATLVKPLGDWFIDLLIMAAVPLLFLSLVSGLMNIQEARTIPKTLGRLFVYYLFTSLCGLSLGLAVTHYLKPGVGFQLVGNVTKEIGTVPSIADIIGKMIPKNIAAAFAQGEVTQIVVFGLFLGLCSLFIAEPYRTKVRVFFETGFALFQRIVAVIIETAPIGLGALTAVTVGQYGAKIAGPLARFLGSIYIAEFLMFLIMMLLLYLIGRVSPITFLKQTYPVYLTAAGTTSSLATLSHTLQVAEERLKLPRSIYGVTLPLGVQFAKDGTAVFLAAVLLFTAQAQGVDVSPGVAIAVVLTGLLLATGSGGIPGGGLVVALVFVKAFGLPVTITAIVGGIYHLIDITNATLNVMNDLVGTVIVTRLSEKQVKIEKGAAVSPASRDPDRISSQEAA